MPATLVLYDHDCGICRRFADHLAARGVPVAPIGSTLGAHWLRDLERADRALAFHAIDESGRRRTGGAAVPLALEAAGHRAAARAARTFPGATRAAYRLLARRRALASRLLRLQACATTSAR